LAPIKTTKGTLFSSLCTQNTSEFHKRIDIKETFVFFSLLRLKRSIHTNWRSNQQFASEENGAGSGARILPVTASWYHLSIPGVFADGEKNRTRKEVLAYRCIFSCHGILIQSHAPLSVF
jgi:hypothetical protein